MLCRIIGAIGFVLLMLGAIAVEVNGFVAIVMAVLGATLLHVEGRFEHGED
jgi:hypothetical protein